jgi:hypothetical protein
VNVEIAGANKKMSLKIMTLNNNRQKINDCLGNPVEIGIAVTWRIVDTAKAAFNVDNYKEYLSLQCDSALRNIVRLYPYDAAPDVDTTGDGVADDGSLRGSSEVVANRIKEEIQARVEEAGLEIVGTHDNFQMMEENFEQALANHKLLGTTNMGIGGYFVKEQSVEIWEDFIKRANVSITYWSMSATNVLFS